MGCYVDKNAKAKDACVISRSYNRADTFYIFNHVDIVISYHSGSQEEWGKFLDNDEIGGRIVCECLVLVNVDIHAPG